MSTEDKITDEETLVLTKKLWAALQAPNWDRESLIELGRLIYLKTPIEKIDGKLFDKLGPSIVRIARTLGCSIRTDLWTSPEKKEETDAR